MLDMINAIALVGAFLLAALVIRRMNGASLRRASSSKGFHLFHADD
ncbi:hypothetical protein WEH80_26190 [Actinomycetes bacterium KLBMP 9759]